MYKTKRIEGRIYRLIDTFPYYSKARHRGELAKALGSIKRYRIINNQLWVWP